MLLIAAIHVGCCASPTPVSAVPSFAFAANENPNNIFGYTVANMSCGTVSGFSVDSATGDLTELASSPVNAGSGPYGVAVSRHQ